MFSLLNRIRQGARRLACWLCNAQYHFNCMMFNHTQTTQRWQCIHCSQKPVADRLDNQMAHMLDRKSHDVRQNQLRILQWNANGIHAELPLLEDLLEFSNMDVVCIQETKLKPKDKTLVLRNFIGVRRDRPVTGEAKRKQIPYKFSRVG